MSLSLYLEGAGKRQKRLGPLAISVAVHVTVFLALMEAPEIKLAKMPDRAKSEYKQAIEGKEEKLVWYKLKELPEVTPPRAKAEQRPLRAEVRAKQEIIASRKDAPKRPQMVWTPAPELRETPPVESPNMLAIRVPEVTKPFVSPPNAPKQTIAKLEMPANAPDLPAQPTDTVKLPDATKIVKRFAPPPRRVPEKITEVVPLTDVPQLEASVNAPAFNYAVKSPTRPFTAPAGKKAEEAGKPVLVEAPPALGEASAAPAPDVLNANSRDLNLAVVGLNPANKPVKVPQGSSPGQFSAGPKIRPDGADAAGDGKGLSVPDLFVRGERDARPNLVVQAYAAPTSALNLREAARAAAGRTDPSRTDNGTREAAPSGPVKVSNAPDPRFNGRDVYMMAIQMPNLTSYSGSWLMWYSDRTAREAGLAPVAAPVAHRKVDPKYIAAAAADKIEGKVQLACVIDKEGHVSMVELVRGLDDRLNQSAVEALAKWEFTPATRHGEPIAVDVLVEIPFKLAPHVQVRY
jgi:TonB family protein